MNDDEVSLRAAAQRRADALGLVAERAMAVGFGGVDRSGDDSGRETAQKTQAPISGTRAEGYQVVLHVDSGTLTKNGESSRSDLEDGTRGLLRCARSAGLKGSRAFAR
jgi:hypothetical protein